MKKSFIAIFALILGTLNTAAHLCATKPTRCLTPVQQAALQAAEERQAIAESEREFRAKKLTILEEDLLLAQALEASEEEQKNQEIQQSPFNDTTTTTTTSTTITGTTTPKTNSTKSYPTATARIPRKKRSLSFGGKPQPVLKLKALKKQIPAKNHTQTEQAQQPTNNQEYFAHHGTDIIFQHRKQDISNCGRFSIYFMYKMLKFFTQNPSGFADHATLVAALPGIAANLAEFDTLSAAHFPWTEGLLACDEINSSLAFIKREQADLIHPLVVLSFADRGQQEKLSPDGIHLINNLGITAMINNRQDWLIGGDSGDITQDRTIERLNELFALHRHLHIILRPKKAHWIYLAVVKTNNGKISFIILDSAKNAPTCALTRETLETIKSMLTQTHN